MSDGDRSVENAEFAEPQEMVFTNPLLARLPEIRREVGIMQEKWTPLFREFSAAVEEGLEEALRKSGQTTGWSEEDEQSVGRRQVKFTVGTARGRKGSLVSFEGTRRNGVLSEVVYLDVGSAVEDISARIGGLTVEPSRYVYRDGIRIATTDSVPFGVPTAPSVVFNLSDRSSEELGVTCYGESKEPVTAKTLMEYAARKLVRYLRRKDLKFVEVNWERVGEAEK